MKQRVLGLLVLISVLTLVFTSTSCTNDEKPENSQADKAKNKNITAIFPETMFIDDYEVRFAVRKVVYPKSLPTLSAKTEGFTDDETVGWFTVGGGKAERTTERVTGRPYSGLYPSTSNRPEDTRPQPKMWEITGEETGTLVLENDGDIMFANLKEYRFYGIMPKGDIANPDAKIIFARDMITEEDAISNVETYVESHGGIPEDARRKITPGQSNIRIMKDGKLVEPIDKTLWYDITYNHRFASIPIEPDEIELTIDALGIARYARDWHKIVVKGNAKNIISPEKAVAVAVSRYAPKIRSRYGIVVSQVRLRYQDTDVPDSKGGGGEFRPVWFIRMTGEEVLVDGHTGEVIGQPWDSTEQRKLMEAMKKFEDYPLNDKIPVPVSISYIADNREIWQISATDDEFAPILRETQNVLSKMRPLYEKKGELRGLSAEIPRYMPEGGLFLQYDGDARLVTNSKIGRDIADKDLPKAQKERRLNYSKDGYHQIYARNVFIYFGDQYETNSPKVNEAKKLFGAEPISKVLYTTNGYTYRYTYSPISKDRLEQLAYRRSGKHSPTHLRGMP